MLYCKPRLNDVDYYFGDKGNGSDWTKRHFYSLWVTQHSIDDSDTDFRRLFFTCTQFVKNVVLLQRNRDSFAIAKGRCTYGRV